MQAGARSSSSPKSAYYDTFIVCRQENWGAGKVSNAMERELYFTKIKVASNVQKLFLVSSFNGYLLRALGVLGDYARCAKLCLHLQSYELTITTSMNTETLTKKEFYLYFS